MLTTRSLKSLFSVVLAASSLTSALPTSVNASKDLEKRSVTPLSASQAETYIPYAYLASSAYCAPSTTLPWTCTSELQCVDIITYLIRPPLDCKKVPDFIPTTSGGDGDYIVYWYVGWYPTLSSVVVAYEVCRPM